MLDSIISALSPIIFVVLLGFLAGKTGAIPKNGSQVFAGFVVKFALPISLFLAAAKAKPEEILNGPYIAALLFGLVLSYFISLGLGYILFKKDSSERSLQALTCSFPNMAYCGPPVLLAAVGPGALLAVVIGNLVTSIILVPITLIFLTRNEASKAHIHTNPIKLVLSAFEKPLVFYRSLAARLRCCTFPFQP